MAAPDDRDVSSSDPFDESEEDREENLEASIMQADRPFASESFGTTSEEQEHGESLDQRVAQERPAKTVTDAAFEIEETDGPDDEAELVGEGSIEHDPFAAPEEEALSVRDVAPGAVDHPDDHGVEDPEG
jgi:hypothetical protein